MLLHNLVGPNIVRISVVSFVVGSRLMASSNSIVRLASTLLWWSNPNRAVASTRPLFVWKMLLKAFVGIYEVRIDCRRWVGLPVT